jgi:aldose 1-epimerase
MQSTQTAVSEPAYNPSRVYTTTPTRKLSTPQPFIESRLFGSLPGGEAVTAWVLTGMGGLKLECIDYGGIVTRLLAPDRKGKLADVILGFRDLDPYLDDSVCLGGIIGRVAGCAPGVEYRLSGCTYKVAENSAENLTKGYNKRVWRATVVHRPDRAPSVRFKMTSEDGDEGHPGTVQIAVTYTVTHDNAFLIETEAVTDKLTPLSLTHRAYFNLAGESGGSIHDHELQIHSDECVAVEDRMTPLGRVEALVNPGNDFRERKPLGAALPHLFAEYGDLYRLRMSAAREDHARLVPAATLFHDRSGRVLEVSTSSRCLQLSTTEELNGAIPGKPGKRYGKHAGIRLECEGYPDGIRHPELGNILLRPGQVKCETTKYAFSTLTKTIQRSLCSSRSRSWKSMSGRSADCACPV